MSAANEVHKEASSAHPEFQLDYCTRRRKAKSIFIDIFHLTQYPTRVWRAALSIENSNLPRCCRPHVYSTSHKSTSSFTWLFSGFFRLSGLRRTVMMSFDNRRRSRSRSRERDNGGYPGGITQEVLPGITSFTTGGVSNFEPVSLRYYMVF